jgi:L-cystine transport system permease protein
VTFDLSVFARAFLAILSAAPLTLAITISALLLGFLIGALISFVRLKNIKVLRTLTSAYVSVTRGTPALLHLMVLYLAIPMVIDAVATRYHWSFRSSRIPLVMFAVIALSVTAGAYMSEIIRSGLLAVPDGQMDAAYAVGMSTMEAVRRIVLPQAVANSLPALCSLSIGILHGSSLAYLISVKEMMGTALVFSSASWQFTETYTALALLYWALTALLERLSSAAEHRWRRYDGGVAR